MANLFIRCYLADVGEALGGCSDFDWLRTLDFFEHRCAYTGENLTPASTVMDHAIPINKDYCGLHLVGNLVPCTNEANKKKHHRSFREFVTDPARLARIEGWIEQTEYLQRAARAGDLRAICAEKYSTIVNLCQSGRDSAFQRFATPRLRTSLPVRKRSSRIDTLPIELICVPGQDFKSELLKRRQGWITVEYVDGRTESRLWTADKLTIASNIIGNLRSRPEFRTGTWQKRGIAKVTVTIDHPGR